MEIQELIRDGKLTEARQQLIEGVKRAPGDPAVRTLLFQVLCCTGEWEKAGQHLEVLAANDAGSGVYQNVIKAEIERHKVFSANSMGSCMSDPPAYYDLFLLLRQSLAQEKGAEAEALLKKIYPLLPQISGTVNGTDFIGLCDTDITLFPFLEVFAHDRYVWVPFEYIREISINPPNSLLDLLWSSGQVATWEGLVLNCFIPVLYPDSCNHTDARIQLGRLTDWTPVIDEDEVHGKYTRGIGQHVFAFGEEDIPLLEIQNIVFNAGE